MNWNKLAWFALFVLIFLFIMSILNQTKQPANSLQPQQHILDSVKAIYSKQLDSINTINVVLNSKIDAKNEVIRTLKGLVNDNNKKYQSITDSALVIELEKLRVQGIR